MKTQAARKTAWMTRKRRFDTTAPAALTSPKPEDQRMPISASGTNVAMESISTRPLGYMRRVFFCAPSSAFSNSPKPFPSSVEAVSGLNRYKSSPAPPQRASLPSTGQLSRSRPATQTSAASRNGAKPTMPQLLAKPRPQLRANQPSQCSVRACRNSSRHQMAAANSSRSSVSPVPAVACSQKLSCSPHASTASSGGSQLVGTVSRAESSRNRTRWSRVRSCGSSATLRASSASVSAAQTAEKAFSAKSCAAAGSSFTGKVSRW